MFDNNNLEVRVGFYIHYKGGIYKVLGFGVHTETEERLVHYIDSKGNVWLRPLTMWNESVDYNGTSVKRFIYFDNQIEGEIEFLKAQMND